MTTMELHQPPRPGQVMREQFRATALSLRIPAIVLASVGALLMVIVFIDFLNGRGGVEFSPQLSMLPAFAGLFLPIALWYRDRPFGQGFFWTLPVDRPRHAAIKILSGWLCLMIAVAGFVLWLLILAFITKGNISSDEMIKLLPSSNVPPSGTLDESMLRTIRWVPNPLLWLVPFTAATGMYIIANAIAVGVRHPVRLIVAVFAFGLLLAAVAQGIRSETFWNNTGNFTEAVLYGRYGLDGLLTGGTESLHTQIRLIDGKSVGVWRGLPVISNWIAATLLWSSLGLVALLAGLMRHRERR